MFQPLIVIFRAILIISSPRCLYKTIFIAGCVIHGSLGRRLLGPVIPVAVDLPQRGAFVQFVFTEAYVTLGQIAGRVPVRRTGKWLNWMQKASYRPSGRR